MAITYEDVIRQLGGEVARLTAERDALRAALAKYGKHLIDTRRYARRDDDPTCRKYDDSSLPCSCGLEALLQR